MKLKKNLRWALPTVAVVLIAVLLGAINLLLLPPPEKAAAFVIYGVTVKVWDGDSYEVPVAGSTVTFFFDGEDPMEVLTDSQGNASVQLDVATVEDWLVLYTDEEVGQEILAYYDANRLQPGVDNTLTFGPNIFSSYMYMAE